MKLNSYNLLVAVKSIILVGRIKKERKINIRICCNARTEICRLFVMDVLFAFGNLRELDDELVSNYKGLNSLGGRLILFVAF